VTLVIAGLQHPGFLGDPAANLRVIDEAAQAARQAGADLLVTPEMFLTGYNLGSDLRQLVADEPAAALSEIARRHQIAIVAGGPEPLADGGIANSAFFVGADGSLLACYRKSHLFGELDRAMFVAGDVLGAPVEYLGVNISLMICYDVEFPETVRAAALAGADVVVVPTAQMEPFAAIAEKLIPVRAWESQVYVAYVNRCGSEKDLRYVGLSSIVAPSGEVLDALGPDESGLMIATIDPEVVRRARLENPYLVDRRPILYAPNEGRG
jgi:predicted amidohydrolase